MAQAESKSPGAAAKSVSSWCVSAEGGQLQLPHPPQINVVLNWFEELKKRVYKVNDRRESSNCLGTGYTPSYAVFAYPPRSRLLW